MAWPEGIEPFTGRLKVSVWLHFARRGKADIDNRIKSLLDAMSPNKDLDFKGAWLNDSQIDELHVFRGHPKPPLGRCVVFVEALEENESGEATDDE